MEEKDDQFFLELQERLIQSILDRIPEHKKDKFIQFYTDNIAKHFRKIHTWMENND